MAVSTDDIAIFPPELASLPASPREQAPSQPRAGHRPTRKLAQRLVDGVAWLGSSALTVVLGLILPALLYGLW